MRKIRILILIATIILLAIPIPVTAQEYSFEVPQLLVDVYWNSDGTSSLDYTFHFLNNTWGHTIEYVDLGLPNGSFDENKITAYVNGNQVFYISRDEFQGQGNSGVAIALGTYAIPPGGTGTVQILVEQIPNVLYYDDKDSSYASAVFSPAYFLSSVVTGNTDLTVTFHLPEGVQPEEPRWHNAPGGFPSEPERGIDEQGRIYYRWRNSSANAHTVYRFGASFPLQYVPDDAITRENPFAWLGTINIDACIPWFCMAFFGLIVGWGFYSSSKLKLKYLPPKISIEGHGIKRGLTAVEAAILLEEPLDKVLTMVLFSVIKKNAAEVKRRDPLQLIINPTLPADLRSYEQDFLKAFEESGSEQRKLIRLMVVALIKSVSEKMKGFSRKDSIVYYQDITKRAWQQVEEAGTPEVKSQKYDEVMEWTMLDRNYDDRTRDVFRHQPVFMPIWWGRFDPGFSGGAKIGGAQAIPGSGSRMTGSDFAASVVNSVGTFSSKVVGNINEFTANIASVTNPQPKTSYSSSKGGSHSGGSGCACACACACAGCACACAGGGR